MDICIKIYLEIYKVFMSHKIMDLKYKSNIRKMD